MLKLPNDVVLELKKRFERYYVDWLDPTLDVPANMWPQCIDLGNPTEKFVQQNSSVVKNWIAAWQNWHGAGTLTWHCRSWPTLGIQNLPHKILLAKPADLIETLGVQDRWLHIQHCYELFITCWPILRASIGKYIRTLSDYTASDLQNLLNVLAWIYAHPNSNLYPRQLPIAGIDSKWFEKRRSLLSNFMTDLRKDQPHDSVQLVNLGMRAMPNWLRLRILDPKLRSHFSGISSLAVLVDEFSGMDFTCNNVIIVENIQTGLALQDLPDTIAFIGCGYNVDFLANLAWLKKANCIYWGDIDTHGFAILHSVRGYVPQIRSILMDQDTLLQHKQYCSKENAQHSAERFTNLTPDEQMVYCGLKQHSWGSNLRLEQERIGWDLAWQKIVATLQMPE